MAPTVPTRSSFAAAKDIPEVIIDTKAKKEYVRGKFLGQGGFGRCYEVVEKETKEVFAGKIVSKARLVKPGHKVKIAQEIQIHKKLDHKHIVGFHSYFEDESNVYIILELCSRRSLLEMNRRRSQLTEGEARYFLRQLLLACRYLREQRVIHRDLKLGNLLLNEAMELKVADFGLAARISYNAERKKTLCGTPNYIAPEVLAKTGHSFEVDVWSIGCVLYTMLVGHPPFDAPSVDETYALIRENKFSFPPAVSCNARALIRRILKKNPLKRPTIDAILEDDFLTSGPLPPSLPTSCLVIPPRFDATGAAVATGGRRPLMEKNEERAELEAMVTPLKKRPENEEKPVHSLKPQLPARPNESQAPPGAAAIVRPAVQERRRQQHLKVLQDLLQQLCSAQPPELSFERPDEAEDPASAPIFWVSKWVDYTEKYGMGYQLCDSSTGVLFNDDTRLVLLSNKVSMMYVDENCAEHYHTLENYPASLEKKATLLKYFSAYMEERLLKTGRDVGPRECDSLARLPVVGSWHRAHPAVSFYLNNGTVQVNFFHDHTKLILCPLMAAVTFVDTTDVFHTYQLKTLQRGCPPNLLSRLQYARTVLDKMATGPR